MASRIPTLQRFFYSHYFFGGVRHTVGIFVPVLVLGGLLSQYHLGIIAAMGALSVAIIDQPGGPRRYRTNEMLAGIVLGTLTVAVTALASSHSFLIWLSVPALCFLLSILTVFGKRGGVIGFACLLLMTLTMRTPLGPDEVITSIVYSLMGGLFYFSFSFLLSRALWHRQLQQTLSVALFATADYIMARSRFYDMETDLEADYRELIRTQSTMIDMHQAARDMVLRELPKGHGHNDHKRIVILNLFLGMVDLLDSLVATHTDYTTLRRELPDSDALIFARDALYKLAVSVSRIALDISRNKQSKERSSVKAELHAIEYELERYKKCGFNQEQPEVYALLVQVLRRLRNATRVVNSMADQTLRSNARLSADQRLDKSITRFLTRNELRVGMLTSNLRMNSSHFRYALRVAIAALIGMTVTAVMDQFVANEGMPPSISAHGYWIILTIIIVMKPGFALTRQRNGWRLTGTLIGCGLTFVVFNLTGNVNIYLAVLVAACILGNSLVQLNYMLAAIFNTVFVLLGFHFLTPGVQFVISERLVDTIIGCSVALLCSYILPWWEHGFMASLSQAAKTANQDYLKAGLRYATISRAQRSEQDLLPADQIKLDSEQAEAELAWRVARQRVHIAFSNFAAAFYRMMDEPVARQENVPELNHLLIQNHVLASQISAAIPLLAALPAVPAGIRQALDSISDLLDDKDATPPVSIETDGELATLAYPLRQMIKAAQLIRQEMRGLAAPTPSANPSQAPATAAP
ncbi:MAG: FUSC family membrane protein [Burkholderiaceae bacterium]